MIHNPWTWQDEQGFVQANEVVGASRTVYCAGQSGVDEDGQLIDGDVGEQAMKALDNLEAVLASADLTLSDVMRLNVFVTDMAAFYANMGPVLKRLGEADCRFAGSLFEVASLAEPGMMVELEATAVA